MKINLKHCILIDALFVHKVITTVVGFVNTVLQMIGWVLYVPGYAWMFLAGKLTDNDLAVMAAVGGLTLPATGTRIWLNSLADTWTTWDYDE